MPKQPTRIEIIIEDILKKISTVTFIPGSRIPSIRQNSEHYGVSPSTVAEAYERLITEGAIYSRPGAGFFVSDVVKPTKSLDIETKLDRIVDPLWISRHSLESSKGDLKPGSGCLPRDWLYEDGIKKGLLSVARLDSPIMSEYAPPMGLIELREFLIARLRKLEIKANLSQLMITDSATHSIDLICRLLLTPNKTVVIDDPCYFNFQALLMSHRVNIVSVPYTTTGPDLDAFEDVVKKHKPSLYITNTGFHNPTTATISPSTAYKIINLAQQENFYIIEDDPYADFEFYPSIRLAALDGLERVFYVSSFSKTLSASLRCGLVVMPNDFVEELINLRIATGNGGSQLASAVILSALKSSGYGKHIRSMHTRLELNRNRVINELEAIHIKPWIIPHAGMFIWCELPDDISSTSLAKKCLKEGVILAPGNAFSLSQKSDNFIRFNIAQSTDYRLFKTIKRNLYSC